MAKKLASLEHFLLSSEVNPNWSLHTFGLVLRLENHYTNVIPVYGHN